MHRANKRQFPLIFLARYTHILDNRKRARVIEHNFIAFHCFVEKVFRCIAEMFRRISRGLVALAVIYFEGAVELDLARQSGREPGVGKLGGVGGFTLGD